jgi:hypothetical protein
VFDDLPVDLPNPTFDFTLGALSVFVEYDGTNSTFTPTQGLAAKLEYQNYDDTWGSATVWPGNWAFRRVLMLHADLKILRFT